MKCLRLGFVSLLTCALLAAPVAAQQPPAKYETAIKELRSWIAEELRTQGIPSLALAVVDDQDIVWAEGFGVADPKTNTLAGPNTVYRVGSVSKPITALALMRLVEQGKLDLDAPVTKYLPEFAPHNPFQKEITLRHLLTHHSGLPRESPVGSYFDLSTPSLAQLVASLKQTTLQHAPGSKFSYSNAGLAVVGYVLERTHKQPFAKVMDELLLKPLGMKHSSFALTPELRKHLATAVVWTHHGTHAPAPLFEVNQPAGNLYTSANDVARLLRCLLASGKADGKQLLRPETLEAMERPQFAKPKDKQWSGLGFVVQEVEGKRRVWHNGNVYGFGAQLEFLPEEKLGLVVLMAKDISTGWVARVHQTILEHLRAARRGEKLPALVLTQAPSLPESRAFAGEYLHVKDAKKLVLWESRGRLWMFHPQMPILSEVRKTSAGDFLTAGAMDRGQKITLKNGELLVGKDTFKRQPTVRPELPSKAWQGLLGEYGPDHQVLHVLEMDGQLCLLIQRLILERLVVVKGPEQFRFTDKGLFPGEAVTFVRAPNGRATQVTAGNFVFQRRKIDGEDGQTFTIKPQRPIEELRKAALQAKPPAEKPGLRKPELVDLMKLDPTLKFDIRYATTNNFLSTKFYTSARAFLQKPAAEALLRAHHQLKNAGYGLLIYDPYRPWHVTKMFWDATPPHLRNFVADPSQGSRHNRGCAVDLTLYDLKTGKPVEMVSGFDEMTDRAYPDYLGGTSRQRWHRDLLRRTMEAEGFTVYEDEWWHFDYRDWRLYPILNLRFEELP